MGRAGGGGRDPARAPGAAAALARYDTGSPKWAKVSGGVARELILENPVHLGSWLRMFHPVRDKLDNPLLAIIREPLRDPARPAQDLAADRANDLAAAEQAARRNIASNLLLNSAEDRPDVLTEALLESDESQFPKLFATVRARIDANYLLRKLDLTAAAFPADPAAWEREARRIARRRRVPGDARQVAVRGVEPAVPAAGRRPAGAELLHLAGGAVRGQPAVTRPATRLDQRRRRAPARLRRRCDPPVAGPGAGRLPADRVRPGGPRTGGERSFHPLPDLPRPRSARGGRVAPPGVGPRPVLPAGGGQGVQCPAGGEAGADRAHVRTLPDRRRGTAAAEMVREQSAAHDGRRCRGGSSSPWGPRTTSRAG